MSGFNSGDMALEKSLARLNPPCCQLGSHFKLHFQVFTVQREHKRQCKWLFDQILYIVQSGSSQNAKATECEGTMKCRAFKALVLSATVGACLDLSAF